MVVKDTVAQYRASKNELNVSGSTLNITSAEMKTYPNANQMTTIRESFCFENTLTISATFFEDRKDLKIRNTLRERDKGDT